MGYIKQVVLILTAGSIFCASKQNNNMFSTKNNGCLFRKINTKEGQVKPWVIFILSSTNRLRKESS
jgi:hypothetical protein